MLKMKLTLLGARSTEGVQYRIAVIHIMELGHVPIPSPPHSTGTGLQPAACPLGEASHLGDPLVGSGSTCRRVLEIQFRMKVEIWAD